MGFLYKVGEVISDEKGSIEILSQYLNSNKKKCYQYHCLKCDYIGEHTENSIKNKMVRCSVCCTNPKIIIKGKNDLLTTNPWIEDYLLDKNDGYKYTAGSGKKIYIKCPVCGYTRLMVINKLSNNRFNCPICSNAISYPNKLMYEILHMLGIDFEREKVFDWSDNKRYDFYIPSLNCIIEMNGSQHYRYAFNRTSFQTQSNDVYKKNLAIHAGITNYLEIDCSVSNCNYIYEKLCQHKILIDIGILNINIEQCDKNVRKFESIYKQVADMWNNGLTTVEIGEKLNLSIVTIEKYLKQATKLGFTNYRGRQDQNRKTRKSIIDLESGNEYLSISECAKAIGRARTYIKYHSERFKTKESYND